MKKIFAAVLAAVTLVSVMSVSAFATSLIDLSEHNPLRTQEFPAHVFATEMSGGSTAQPETSIYIPIADGTGFDFGIKDFSDTDYFTVSVKAIEGAKYVKKISRVSEVDFKCYWAVDSNIFGLETLSGRHDYIKIELKPDQTDAEYKMQFEITLKAKNKADAVYTGTAKGKSAPVFVGNQTVSGGSFVTGQNGQVFKPVKNEENEINWSNLNDSVARLTFTADTDEAKMYPKLTTKWNDAEYTKNFADQDAYLFDFVNNPYISSTSRAILEIYNPFYDAEADKVTVDITRVAIYEVTEDGLIDVTKQFSYGDNKDGDSVFTTKTRRLGTYIFAEKAITVDKK